MSKSLQFRSSAAWRSTYGRLVLLVLLALVPVLAFTTVMVVDRTRSEQSEVEKRLDGEAMALARGVDDLVESMRTDLEVLAVAPSLVNDDFEGFHTYITAVAQSRGYIINLVAADRRFLLSSAAPYGTTFNTPAAEDVVGPVFRGAKFQLSDLGSGLLTNHPRALLAVPVVRQGIPVYALTGSIFAERASSPVQRMRLPDGWVAAVLDARGRFVARSAEPERFVGQLATAGAIAAMQRGFEGVARGPANDGTPVVAAVRRSASGWWAVVSMTSDAYSEPLTRSLAIVSLGALGALALSLALATLFAGRIAQQIGSLADAAEALGAGRPVPEVSSSLTEVEEVGRALAEAGEKIRRGELQVRDSEARLSLAQELAGIGTFEFDPATGEIHWSQAQFALHGRDPTAGPPTYNAWLDILHPADRARVNALVERAARDDGVYSSDYRIVLPSGDIRWLAGRGRVFPAEAGKPRRLVGVNYDVSDRKLREERQALMVRELHHRVKNTLATVQAIIGSTARSVSDMDSFRESVIGRIASLARTHTLLTDAGWSEIALEALVQGELEPYGDGEHRVSIEGPALRLSADTGMALGMVLHELSTNAAKYGALSAPQGRVAVHWRVEGDERTAYLIIDWQETGGPVVQGPEREGFGSRLMTRVLSHQLKAELTRTFAPEGFRCRIRMPLAKAAEVSAAA